MAVAANGVIGRQGELPWRLSTDLRRFKRLTMGHHLIMGRKTFESIGRPLPGRTTVVVTRQPEYERAGVLVTHGLMDALRICANDDEAFIIGGAELYRHALPHVQRIYLTRVHTCLDGDVFFPEIVDSAWQIVAKSHHPADETNEFETTFCELVKR